jgi:hypothetical protein
MDMYPHLIDDPDDVGGWKHGRNFVLAQPAATTPVQRHDVAVVNSWFDDEIPRALSHFSHSRETLLCMQLIGGCSGPDWALGNYKT